MAIHAAEWAVDCNWWHEMPAGEGQNLWLGPMQPDGVEATQAWFFNEEVYYDYEENYCLLDKVCGHYFQVRREFSRVYTTQKKKKK